MLAWIWTLGNLDQAKILVGHEFRKEPLFCWGFLSNPEQTYLLGLGLWVALLKASSLAGPTLDGLHRAALYQLGWTGHLQAWGLSFISLFFACLFFRSPERTLRSNYATLETLGGVDVLRRQLM